MISIIAAMSKNRVIGKDNKIPWHLPEDLRRFRELTSGKVIIMGRKTYESIGKPLPKRINVVVSSKMESTESIMVYHDLIEAIEAMRLYTKNFNLPEEIMIIGGAEIYNQTVGICDKLYMTILDKEYDGDTFFPEIDMTTWKVVDTNQKEGHSYITYEKQI